MISLFVFVFCLIFVLFGRKKTLDLVSSDFSLLNVRNSRFDPTSRTFWGRRRRNHTCNDYAFFPVLFGLELEKEKNGEEEVFGVGAVIMLHLLLLSLI